MFLLNTWTFPSFPSKAAFSKDYSQISFMLRNNQLDPKTQKVGFTFGRNLFFTSPCFPQPPYNTQKAGATSGTLELGKHLEWELPNPPLAHGYFGSNSVPFDFRDSSLLKSHVSCLPLAPCSRWTNCRSRLHYRRHWQMDGPSGQ